MNRRHRFTHVIIRVATGVALVAVAISIAVARISRAAFQKPQKWMLLTLCLGKNRCLGRSRMFQCQDEYQWQENARQGGVSHGDDDNIEIFPF